MPMPDRERWKQLSPELDVLLGVTAQLQAHRLAAIRCHDACLAAELAALLEASAGAAAERFLETRPGRHPGLREIPD
jgi:hypothetical protein